MLEKYNIIKITTKARENNKSGLSSYKKKQGENTC
jgi:hypothetical protein